MAGWTDTPPPPPLLLAVLVQGRLQSLEPHQPSTDEHVLLDDNRYMADVMFEFRQMKAKEGFSSKLLFKKRMFRETDETITEPQFVNLSYIQAQHDYLAGQYPVIREDAAQMCALQMHAEYGPTLVGDAQGFEAALEKFMVKQVCLWGCVCVWVRGIWREVGQGSEKCNFMLGPAW
jgi:hypothetical protein